MKLFILIALTMSFNAFAGDKHFNPELLEKRKPYGKIFQTQASTGEKLLLNSAGILNILFYGDEGVYRGFKEYLYFSCVSESCDKLDLVYVFDRPNSKDDNISILSTVLTSDINAFMADFSDRSEEEKNRILSEGAYDQTNNVLNTPDAPAVVLPAAAISAGIDTVKAPFWNIIKSYRANSYGNKSKKIIEDFFNTKLVGETEVIEREAFGKIIRSFK